MSILLMTAILGIFNTFLPISMNHLDRTFGNLMWFVSDSIYGLQIFSILLTLEALSFLTPSIFNNEFKYRFSKKSAELGTKEGISKADQIKYIMMTVKWYDRYIRDTLSIHIKSREKTINDLVKSILNEDKQLVRKIYSDLGPDKLTLMKTLEDKFQFGQESYFTEYTVFDRIKVMSEFIVPIIAIVITLIGFTIQ